MTEQQKPQQTAAENPALKPLPLPKRFYQAVSTEAVSAETAAAESGEQAAAYAVLLDGRAVKTPARQRLLLPSQALAELVADEFCLQREVINPALMPITRLANTVIDAIAADMQPVQEDILRYLGCDMVFYRAGAPEKLARRQAESWDKALDWALQAMGAEFSAHEGVMFTAQKPEAMAAASGYLRRRTQDWQSRGHDFAPFALAALHLMVNLTGSALLALMAAAGAAEVKEIWRLAHIEEDWMIEQWGEDSEAQAKRAGAERDFYAAAAVLAALKAA